MNASLTSLRSQFDKYAKEIRTGVKISVQSIGES